MGNLEENPFPGSIFDFAAWFKEQIVEDLEERNAVWWANYSPDQIAFKLPEPEGEDDGTTH